MGDNLIVTYKWTKEVEPEDGDVFRRYRLWTSAPFFHPYAIVDRFTEEFMKEDDSDAKPFSAYIYTGDALRAEVDPEKMHSFYTLHEAKQYCEHILLGGPPPDCLRIEQVERKLDGA